MVLLLFLVFTRFFCEKRFALCVYAMVNIHMDEELAKRPTTPTICISKNNHTLRNYVMINKSWWDFLDSVFSHKNPVGIQHVEKIPDFSGLLLKLISEYYSHSYGIYKQLDLLASDWVGVGCSKNVFLVNSQNRFMRHYLGKVDWKPKFPLVVKLYITPELLYSEQCIYQHLLRSPYHDHVLPHKFFDNFSVSPYVPKKPPRELCDLQGMHLPRHLVNWNLHGFWFEPSKRYEDSKQNKHFYKFKLIHKNNFDNICMYKDYPRFLDLGDIEALCQLDKDIPA